jgi:SAM-dependent methyltransferase
MSGNALFRQHGDTYARRSEHGLPNAAYDRPAILRLAGDVAGRRVLELGCAAGVLTRQLVDRGASVLALDREPRMAALARQRLDGRARVEVADLEQPLDMVAEACIDLVVASLVLHYIEDWRPLLAELHRCLVPGGALVFSIHHPITGWQLSDKSDYHRTELIGEQYDYDGQTVTADMYRRPFSAIFSQLRGAGFIVDVVDEPQPETAGEPRDPELHILQTQPVFLFIRALRA